MAVGTLTMALPSLVHLGRSLLDFSAAAVLVDIAFCVRNKRFDNLGLAVLLLAVNFVDQALSGWRGLILTTMVTLGALLYPMMRRAVLTGGAVFVAFWALYFHPFGTSLRDSVWYGESGHQEAVVTSIADSLNMAWEDRLD